MVKENVIGNSLMKEGNVICFMILRKKREVERVVGRGEKLYVCMSV